MTGHVDHMFHTTHIWRKLPVAAERVAADIVARLGDPAEMRPTESRRGRPCGSATTAHYAIRAVELSSPSRDYARMRSAVTIGSPPTIT